MRNLSKVLLISLVPLFAFSNEIQTLSDTKQEIIKLKQINDSKVIDDDYGYTL